MSPKEKETILSNYLDKRYKLENNRIWTTYNPHIKWGLDVVDSLSVIFNFDKEKCKEVLRYWCFTNGLDESEWKNICRRNLNVTWTPEMADELRGFHNIDAEAELTAMLSAQLTTEIDQRVIQELLNLNNGRDNNINWQGWV